MGDEADYLNDQCDWGAEEDFYERQRERASEQINVMVHRYNKASEAETGATFECPTCGKYTVKRTYHKKFCSNGRDGSGKNCKDAYWNQVDPKRRKSAKFFKSKNKKR